MRFRFGNFGRLGSSDSSHESSKWRCCFCCHVRTGTIFLGVWHLSLHMLSLAAIAVLVLHPQVANINKSGVPINPGNDISFLDNDGDQDMLAVLPTPLSAEVREESFPKALPVSELNPAPGEGFHSSKPTASVDSSSKLLYGSFVYKDWFGERPSTNQHVTHAEDLNISIGVNFCTLGITILMIYGAVRGKSLYLMPFFCLQAFDFFVTSLSVIGYLSFVPDIRQVLIKSPSIPLRDELLAMDPQCLSLLILAGILLTLVAKVYFISIVWNCYKFLTLRAETTLERENITGVIDGPLLDIIPSSLGSDLPDYATAMTDPRFAKKPAYSTPPPPYTAVVNLESDSSVPSDAETNSLVRSNAIESAKP